MSKILDEILQLKAEIAKHDEAYHGNDNPTISDAEYDELRKKLAEYQQNYPHFFSVEEEKVGAKSLDIFNKIKHSKPMLSLANGLWTGFELLHQEDLGDNRFSVRVRKRGDSSINDLMQSLMNLISIEAIEEYFPDMQEVFVQLIQEKDAV